MDRDRLAKYRRRFRTQGLRPLEVRLPTDMIDQIDAMKLAGESRDTVIGRLLAAALSGKRMSTDPNQLHLAL